MKQGRSYWSGRLLIEGSAVNIPISLYTVMEKNTTGLAQMSSCCKQRVNHKKVCSKCGKDLRVDEVGKAYALGKDLIPIDEQHNTF